MVFDVIGEVLVGKSLKDLIIEAIANRRTMDDILQDFEKVPDEEAIRKVREASLEALAVRHIDLTRILGEQRRAMENRLVPEYVEEFFKRAAKALNIKMEKGKDDLWRIAFVPSEVRNQPHGFKTKFGEVRREYAKMSFDKETAANAQAEFVAMGHPLLEAVINTILSRYDQSAADGATFIDPEGKKDGIIWFLEAEIKDGKNEVAGKRLFAVYQDLGPEGHKGEESDEKDAQNRHFQPLSLVSPAILWDLKPLSTNAADTAPQKEELKQEISLDKDAVVSYVISEGLESYKKELLERRIRDAKIKEKYGIRSLDSMIAESDGKLASYYERQMKGENIPEVTIQNEQKKKEDLENKRQRLQKEIEAETHLYPTDPKILGAVRVVPGQLPPVAASDEEMSKLV